MYIVLGFRKNGQSFMKHQGNVQLKLRFVVLIAFVLYMYIFLVKCLYMIFLGGKWPHSKYVWDKLFWTLSLFSQLGSTTMGRERKDLNRAWTNGTSTLLWLYTLHLHA